MHFEHLLSLLLLAADSEETRCQLCLNLFHAHRAESAANLRPLRREVADLIVHGAAEELETQHSLSVVQLLKELAIVLREHLVLVVVPRLRRR